MCTGVQARTGGALKIEKIESLSVVCCQYSTVLDGWTYTAYSICCSTMVFHYTIRGGPCLNAHSHITLSSSDITCYVGRDKHENEFLIKYGWPGDIWFHVDSLSSAHVYFRVCTEDVAVPVTGIPIDDLPEDSVYDMMQIVKHNSISGSKLASTKIVYTPHSNLKKTFDMETGTVTYHDTKLCRYKRCDKDKKRVKELENTKIERSNVDFYEEMKANERRIIERKKRERMESQAATNVLGELYDPIKVDLQTERIKASRQGDDSSGLDKGIAQLEGLSFSAGTSSCRSSAAAAATNARVGVNLDSKEEADTTSPVWVQDANNRLLESSSPSVRFLRARGYTMLEAVGALEASAGSCIVALQTLWRSPCCPTNMMFSAFSSQSSSAQVAAQAARQEEKEVLQAIFGEDNDDGVSFSHDETLFDAIYPITSYEPPSRYGSLPPPLLLEVYVDNGIAPLYPNEPPVLALVGGGLPETLVRELTNRLKVEALKRCQEEPADPQIFNLLGFVAQEVEKIIENETVELEVQRKKRLMEDKAETKVKRKAEADRKGEENSDQLPPQATLFKNEMERRAYAKEVLSNANSVVVNDRREKLGGERYYNTGVSDQSLINDLF